MFLLTYLLTYVLSYLVVHRVFVYCVLQQDKYQPSYEYTVFSDVSTSNHLYIFHHIINISYSTRNSSGDEIANVNFLYDDIVHALKIQ